VSNTAPKVRFRQHSAITVAAVIAAISGISLANWAPYLLPVLIVPLAVAAWSWRSGTDADADGLTVRAVVGARRIPWTDVVEIGRDPRGRTLARLTSGAVVALPAVTAHDLPQLVAASGQDLVTEVK